MRVIKVSAEGVEHGKDKVRAIMEMPTPTTKEEVRRFLPPPPAKEWSQYASDKFNQEGCRIPMGRESTEELQ